MIYLFTFLSGLFLANGIPHFVNGISGKDFHNPSVHRLFKNVPSPLFNVIWGLLNFVLAALFMFLTPGLVMGLNAEFIVFSIGFSFSAIGLSIYFKNRKYEN